MTRRIIYQDAAPHLACTRCKQVLPIEKFPLGPKRNRPNLYYRSWCPDCHRASAKESKQKARAQRAPRPRKNAMDPARKLEFTRYNMMRSRCHNPNHKHYKNYGGRGIALCDRWLLGDGTRSGFECYLEDMGPRPDGCTIDRIDNNGPYSPENCRWATWEEQHANKRTNKYLTLHGRTLTIAQWERETGFGENVIENRIKRGWTIERALTVAPDTKYQPTAKRMGHLNAQP